MNLPVTHQHHPRAAAQRAARVLHVAEFAAPYPGAFIRQLRMLDDELQRRGDGRCAFAFPHHAEGREWLRQLRADGFEVHLLPAPSHRRVLSQGKLIARLAAELRPDIVHSHFSGYDLAVAHACRLLRRQRSVAPAQVWHYRTALEEPVEARPLRRRVKDWLKYALHRRQVDRCVSVTEATAVEAAARGMGERAQAIVSGCDSDVFRADQAQRAATRAELGVSDEQVLVMHMGWHWKRKGGDLLAQAARILQQRGHSNLVFASIGAPLDEVEQPVRALPPTDSVQHLHQASDIFVSASRSEAFGNGLVEALACERVAAAALVSGQRELFERLQGCAAFEPGDAHDLADALEQLLAAQESWGELGRANRQHIVEHASMRTWAGRIAKLYEELRPLSDAVRSNEVAA